MDSCGECWGNARDFGSQDFGGANAAKDARKLAPAGIHQKRVNLMVDEGVHFENAIAEVFALLEDALFEFVHGVLQMLSIQI
jgi:hypothetical protein